MSREPACLTTREVAELLRIGERRVYELARRGELPCTRATGRLLFPREAVLARIPPPATAPAASFAPAPADVLAGSHDPLLEWALRESESGIASWFDGSEAGLARFLERRAAIAALHLHEPRTDTFNIERVRGEAAHLPAVLVAWAVRSQGLLLRPGLAARVRGLEDLAGLRFVPRQPGSGAAARFAALAVAAGLDPASLGMIEPARTETEVALAVASGRADAGFGLEALAGPFGLDFLPLCTERFDLLVDRRAWFEPPFQRLFAFTRTRTFEVKAAAMGGYDVSGLGRVIWNAPA